MLNDNDITFSFPSTTFNSLGDYLTSHRLQRGHKPDSLFVEESKTIRLNRTLETGSGTDGEEEQGSGRGKVDGGLISDCRRKREWETRVKNF